MHRRDEALAHRQGLPGLVRTQLRGVLVDVLATTLLPYGGRVQLGVEGKGE